MNDEPNRSSPGDPRIRPSKFGAGYTVGQEAQANQAPPPAPPTHRPPTPSTGYRPPTYPATSPPPPGQPWGNPHPQGTYPVHGSAPSGGDLIAKVRSNKLLLHAAAGTIGGAAGALLAEVAANIHDTSRFMSVLTTGLWSSIFASVIAVSLSLSDTWHQRRAIRPNRVLTVWILGAAAGFIAGAVAQAIFLIDFGSIEFQNYVLRSFCWGIAGVLIGGMLSRTVPNLGLARGAVAGFIGGCAGGIGFVLVSTYLPEMLGRLVGIAAIGLALGVAMYVVESIFREASLQVVWGPHDTAHVGLGAQPVTIGGGIEDDVVVSGMPSHSASVVLVQGRIEYVEHATGRRTQLTNGSHFQVGSVALIVHAGR